ncbi:MAG: hypothetical protein ACFFCI_16885 [Promethearchaeota archaeon]
MSLKELELKENNPVQLPESIGKIPNLEEIYPSNCNFSIFPESISKLESIIKIDLGGIRL